jgi:hypothetical protein
VWEQDGEWEERSGKKENIAGNKGGEEIIVEERVKLETGNAEGRW